MKRIVSAMAAMTVIRRAEEKDIPAVLELLRQVLEVHHEGRPDLFAAEGGKYSPEELQAIFADASSPVFVFDDGASVKGYIFCRLEDHSGRSEAPHRSLYIDDLCVEEGARGTHIGKRLYGFAREFARSQGCYNITLHVWECNPGAKAFYGTLGLRPQYTSLEEIL